MFRIGDAVRSNFHLNRGEEGVIVEQNVRGWIIDGFTKGSDYGPYKIFAESYLELIAPCETISKKKPIMNNLSNIAKKLFDANTKTLVKAGYLRSDLELSDKGKEALEAINLEANMKALVDLAQADLDEEAKTK